MSDDERDARILRLEDLLLAMCSIGVSTQHIGMTREDYARCKKIIEETINSILKDRA